MTQLLVTSQASSLIRGREQVRASALVVARLVDEWTQAPPPVVTARSLTPRVSAHVTDGHLVLTGLAEVAFPTLSTAVQEVVVELRRPGRAAEQVSISVPAGATLPYRPADLPVASTPIALTGRVTDAVDPFPPIPLATVGFAGAGADLIALSTTMAGGHAEGTTVQARALTAGAATTLSGAARAGDQVLALGSTSGMPANRVLRLRGPATGAPDDYVVVAAVLATGLVSLRLPLRTTPDPAATVTRMNLGAAGAATTLRRAARPGDGVLLVQAALAAAIVEIVDGPATEYRGTAFTTDADGRWRLSGVRGVSDLAITVAAAGFTTSGPTVHPLAPIDPTVINTALST
jgi:hypothetical protein